MNLAFTVFETLIDMVDDCIGTKGAIALFVGLSAVAVALVLA